MKTRITFNDEGQDLQFLDIDEETGRICKVSSGCSATVANIYIGCYVDMATVHAGQRLAISDPSNAGKLLQSRQYIAGIENL